MISLFLIFWQGLVYLDYHFDWPVKLLKMISNHAKFSSLFLFNNGTVFRVSDKTLYHKCWTRKDFETLRLLLFQFDGVSSVSLLELLSSSSTSLPTFEVSKVIWASLIFYRDVTTSSSKPVHDSDGRSSSTALRSTARKFLSSYSKL